MCSLQHGDRAALPTDFTQEPFCSPEHRAKSVSQSSRIKPQTNMPLVQVGLDLLFDKRCLIMGFSTKPGLNRAATIHFHNSLSPAGRVTLFLGVLRDGLCDLFWLVQTCDFTRGKCRDLQLPMTKTCHKSRTCDFYLRCQSRTKEHQRVCASLSLSSLNLHATFEFQRLPETQQHTQTHTRRHSGFPAQSSKRKHIFQEK